jgi:hypothetical protein
MTLDDVYEQLATGELRMLAFGDAAVGTSPEKYAKLLPAVKLGLTQLHKKFLLREGVLPITLIPGKVSYTLDKRYAESNTASTATKWIMDADDPYLDNFLKIERILDADGEEIPLNVVGNASAIRTPTHNSFIVPDTLESATLSVVYRADHPAIDKYLATAAPGQVTLDLPASHLLALVYFVASRIINPVGPTPAGNFHEGNNYAAKFETECAELMSLNVGYIEDTVEHDNFSRNGWT